MSTQDDGESTSREPLRQENINATAIKGRDYSSIIDQKAIKRKKFIKWGIIISLILIAVILAIVLPITLSNKNNGGDGPGPTPPTPPPPIIPEHYNPYNVNPSDVANGSSSFSVLMKAPTKYNPQQHMLALDRVNPTLKDGTKKLSINSRDIPEGPNNLFSANVRMNVDMIKWKVAHLTLTDENKTRFSIPEQAVSKPKADDTMRLDMIGFHYSHDPFFVSFNDTRNKSNWFVSTFNQSLVFMDKFIQMDFLLPSQRLYGLGERVHDFQLDEGTWTMWAIGLDSPYDDGTGRKGVYGVHPFVLVQTAIKNDYIGIFFRNSNAQTPVIKYNADGTSTLSYITTGGQIEIYFFIHGTAKDIIAQYHQFFGTPNLPPFWSLGWQQASWKYINRQMVEDVIDKYAQNQMPLETVYLDIPYMNNYADFTVNETAFPKLYELADRLHNNSQKLVLIVDAAISAEDASANNTYFTMGQKDNIFIKSSMYKSDKYNNTLLAKVWPEVAVFVDWWNPKCMNMWSTGLKDLYDKVQYDGLWIDMNEPTTFNHGELDHSKVKTSTQTPRFLQSTDYDYNWYYQFKQDESSTFKLPFIPRYDPNLNGTDPYKSNYDYMTLSLNATVDGLNGALQYDVHSLYGHMMANKTHLFMTSSLGPRPDDRPFILTRSSFASTGRYASHWLGDNWRDWNYMKYSIAGIMNMNMFGIPQAGADVCGFFGEKKDDEMCARWIQLATFYPLARNHQNLTWKGNDSEFSEPYLLVGKYKDWAKQSIRERFKYMRQLYTCLYEVSQNGGTCFDPLFYHFADDDNVYKNYSNTFIYANAIKVSPVLSALEPNQTSFKSYFPKGQWVSLNNFASIVNSTGDWYDLPTDQPLVQSHLKQGSLIAYQNLVTAKGQQVMTTSDLLQQSISILINRDESGYSSGSLLLDKGISISELKNNEFEYYTVLHQQKSIQFQLAAGQRGKQDSLVDQFVILNAKDMRIPAFACYLGTDKKFNTMSFKYDEVTNALYLTPRSPTKFSQILNVYYGNQGELNFCDSSSFQYRVPNGSPGPNLTLNYTEFDLEHVGGVLPNLHVTLRVLSNYIVNVKWSWKLDQDGNLPQGKRKPAEVPTDIIDTANKPLANLKLNQFVSWQANPFQLNFKYRSQVDPSNVLTIHGMLYDSYLNWIDVTVNTLNEADFSGVFGLGQRASKDFFIQDGVYSMWARDQPTPDETGSLPGANMYGTHPYFMYKHKKQAWVGVFYNLANAQDWWIKNDINGGKVNLTTVATGGVADIYVIQGQTPDAVVQNYFSLIGNPVLIPQWALGWHQSRWGYTSVDQLQNVIDGYEKYNIPLDTLWSDIDYLNKYRDFEIDMSLDTFARLPEFVVSLHSKNMQYVPILDAGIAYRPGEYPAFDDGMAKDLFAKVNNQTFIGQVWPNDAVYPDFFHPETPAWWKANLKSLYTQIKFDGLWEDMNEAANFCNGACYKDQKVQNPVKHSLQYIPTGRDLETKSMPLDVTHYNGYLELDAHNYFGTQEVRLTHEWFKEMGKRTFIIERSSFAGSGKFASVWLGDNFSHEKYMGYSVSGIMQMNMFGIPFAGSDICGFIDDTNAKLCAKWHLVGAFYPFSRNHNNWGQIPQEPYVDMFSETYDLSLTYRDLMRNSIMLKYSLVRYYYTYLFLISTQGIGTLYKPLFFEFPDDVNAYQEITKNIMLGPALKLSINPESLEDNSTIYYFPAGVWCDIIKLDRCMNSTGQSKSMTNKLYDFGLHLRQGYIVPFQDVTQMEDVKTTRHLQNKTIDLHILGESTQPGNTQWRAQGLYVNDDGLSTNLTGNFNSYSIVAKSMNGIQINFFNTVKATAWKEAQDPDCYAVNKNDYVQNIYIYNANEYGNGKDYKALGVMIGGTNPVDLGIAKYNTDTDRVELKLTGPICMTKIQTITLQ